MLPHNKADFLLHFRDCLGFNVLDDTDWLSFGLGGSFPDKMLADNEMVGMHFATVLESVLPSAWLK